MSEQSERTRVASMYDQQATNYANFKEGSFAWRFIESRAFDRYLGGDELPYLPALYGPDTKVLDLGCGAGLVAQHLISRGMSPENITGIDLSQNLVQEAQARVPKAHFIQGSIDSFDLPGSSFDLVTSNMVFHYLNNEQLSQSLKLVYEVLKPGGTLFFVDADPDYNEMTRDPNNINKWLELPTPWGTTAPWFSRNPYDLLLNITYFAGFDLVGGFPLTVAEDGRAYPEEYQKYTSYPARMAARLEKVSEQEKQRRLVAIINP